VSAGIQLNQAIAAKFDRHVRAQHDEKDVALIGRPSFRLEPATELMIAATKTTAPSFTKPATLLLM
jgi:hypothetical protein